VWFRGSLAACRSAFWFVILVAMEWTAAITGKLHGVISGFFSEEKKFGEPSSKAEMDCH
jgi:hypothetical protein